MRNYFIISVYIFHSCIAFAQTDSTLTQGTIKISKPKSGKIYIKVYKEKFNYDVSNVNDKVSSNMVYQPFPGVGGYSYPFNYTNYFNEKFKTKKIDLQGKATDTVKIEIKVLANGKVYITDKTKSVYNEKENGVELNRLQLGCLNILKEIKSWEPAYVEVIKKDKFKNQTVIKPKIAQIPYTQSLFIVFSSDSFEEY